MSIVDGLLGAGVERELGGGYATPVNSFPEKNVFHLKWRVLVHSKRYLCPFPCQKKMLNFTPEVVIWWTLKMYFW